MYTGRIKPLYKRNQFISLRDAALNLGIHRLITLLDSKQIYREMALNQKLLFDDYDASTSIPIEYIEKDNLIQNGNFFLNFL